MRVVAGRYKGRALVTPQHQGLRPTSDRVREAVFNILEHGGPAAPLEGARVLDLFAGTGALGIEALSRGAAFVLFVEDHGEARALIRRNVEAFGLTGQSKIFRRDATDLGEAGTMAPFDIAFLDPPYEAGLGERALMAAAAGGWLKPGAVCILEERARVVVSPPAAFEVLDQRGWGETAVTFLRFTRDAVASAGDLQPDTGPA